MENEKLFGTLLPGRVSSAEREQAPADDACPVGIRVRHQDGEFVAADPEGAVGRADGRDRQAAHLGQQLVAGGMAGCVVDELEVVEIDQHEREGRGVATRVLELAVELLVERAMVAEPGQRVSQRVEAGDLVELTRGGRREVSSSSAGRMTLRAIQKIRRPIAKTTSREPADQDERRLRRLARLGDPDAPPGEARHDRGRDHAVGRDDGPGAPCLRERRARLVLQLGEDAATDKAGGAGAEDLRE